MSKSNFNIAIVGGGPAATGAAIYALQNSLSVIIVERELFPRDRPGETLHPGAEVILKQLGVVDVINSAGFIRHNGILVKWDTKQEFQPFNSTTDEEWLGYQAYRCVFDDILLRQARLFGAEISMGHKAEKIIIDKQRVIGVVVNGKEILADYVIDASGSWHWLARQLNIPTSYFSRKLHARYGYYSGSCPRYDDVPEISADSEGWTWIARVKENLYQWTRLNFDYEKKIDVVDKELSSLNLVGKIMGADVTWRLVDRVSGPGFFIAGDAAAVLDPASSHGVLKAMMSGIQASYLIMKTLKEGISENIAIDAYKDWLWEWFFSDIKKLTLFYKKLGQNIAY